MQVWATAVAPWSARASVEVADGAGSGDGAKEVASVGTVVSIGDDFMLGTLPGCIVCVSVGGGGGFVHGGMGRDVVAAMGSSVIVHSVKGSGRAIASTWATGSALAKAARSVPGSASATAPARAPARAAASAVGCAEC